jgi:hypothetical protein
MTQLGGGGSETFQPTTGGSETFQANTTDEAFTSIVGFNFPGTENGNYLGSILMDGDEGGGAQSYGGTEGGGGFRGDETGSFYEATDGTRVTREKLGALAITGTRVTGLTV